MTHRIWIPLLLLPFFLAACGTEATLTPTLQLLPTTTPASPDTAVSAPEPTATLPPPVGVTNEPTNPPTDAPTNEPTSQPAEEPTSAPPAQGTASPSASGELLAPGQSAVGDLTADAFVAFPYEGVRFTPRLFFAQPAGSLDVELRAYGGGIQPDGVALVNPQATANFGGAGVPEMLVYTPQTDEVHTTAVASLNNTAGNFRLYLFDATTQTADTAVLEQINLAPGEIRSFQVDSPDGNPVIIMADPLGTAEDVLVTARDEVGTAGEANFGGGGSAEALYLLPLRATTYTVEISEVTAQSATVNLHIVTLGPPNLEE